MSKRSEKRLERALQQERERALPERASDIPQVVLRTQPQHGHPWVFRRMLHEPEQRIAPGTMVEVLGRNRAFFGWALYNGNSEIALRLLSDNSRAFPDRSWFAERIKHAVALRHEVLRLPERCNAYRVVHSEGDGLSGLVVDRFDRVLAIELFSAGIFRHLDWILPELERHFEGFDFLIRADHRTEKQEGVRMDRSREALEAKELTIFEGKVRYRVDLRKGHKTGFFVDQRDNRLEMAQYCRGQTLFDGFCYSGGFALTASIHGARHVDAVDLDEHAIAIAEQNRKLNADATDTENISFLHGNVFDVLREYRATGKRYQCMVLDPAKQALARSEREKALYAYTDMNRLGMQCLEPGGILLSCSCTGLIQEEEFIDALRSAANSARKELQIFKIAGASPDHPFAARMPEGRYLNAVYARVLELP